MKITHLHSPVRKSINDDARFAADISLSEHGTPVVAPLVNFLLELSSCDKRPQPECRPAEFYAFVGGVEGVVLF